MGIDDVYDAIVIGAGPAGSEFAYRMARKGFRVLVLEKEKLCREKPCGGGIPVREMAEFGKLPVSAIERYIRKMRLVSPNNIILEMPLKDSARPGATVKREVYDSFLQKRAMKAGAVFIERCKAVEVIKEKADDGKSIVRVKTLSSSGEDAYSARVLADASGFPSSIKGLSKRFSDEDIVTTCHVWMRLKGAGDISERVGDCIEMYCGKGVIPKGYAWIFPKKDVLSVGIGTLKSVVKSEKLSLKGLLDDFIKRHPVASKKLRGGVVVRRGGGLIPVRILSRLHSGRTVFIGDAGGFANPLNGGGIYQARKSAMIAAKHCARMLSTKAGRRGSAGHKGDLNHLEAYDSEAREFFNENDNRWSLKMRNSLWNDSLLDSIVREGMSKRDLRMAINSLITMDEYHKKAYSAIEKEMIGVIHSAASKKLERYRMFIDNEMGEGAKGCSGALFSSSDTLDSYARHSFYGDAKRLRVSLVLLACDIFNGDLKKAARLAPVYELLHTASLVHDDIIDDAGLRRGRKALHELCGKNKAIVAGDYMIGKGFGILSRFDEAGLSARQMAMVLSAIESSTSRCCRGQIMDMEMSEDIMGNAMRIRRGYDIGDYIRMVGLKTGSMIQGAMEKGALIADAGKSQLDTIRMIGLNVGIAFQIMDDCMDVMGSNGLKSSHTDIRQGKVTPMLIYAMKEADSGQKAMLKSAVGRENASMREVRSVVDVYRDTGAIEYAQRLSGIYADKAMDDIRKLERRKDVNNEALETLKDVAEIMGYWGLLGKS